MTSVNMCLNLYRLNLWHTHTHTHILLHFNASSPLCLTDSHLACDTPACVYASVWHIFHQGSPACSDVTALPSSPVCVCLCARVCASSSSARWPLMTPTHGKWHMSTIQPRVTDDCPVSYDIHWARGCWRAGRQNKARVVSSSLMLPGELGKSAMRGLKLSVFLSVLALRIWWYIIALHHC